MSNLLLEIGTEELPGSFILPALEQLADATARELAEARIEFGKISTFATPRRMALYVQSVAAFQRDARIEARGPAKSVAFDVEGRPTRAAEGFARAQKVDISQLEVRETPQGAYVFAVRLEPGRPTGEVAAKVFPEILSGLSFPKMMRWGEGRFRFGRPIRWLVALLGDQEISFEIDGLRSGRVTRGHRFLHSDPIVLPDTEAYWEAMRKGFVVVDQEERKERIVTQVEALAAGIGGKVVWEPGLLEEVVFVVEYPTAFRGGFDARYLDLPRPVLVTTMKKHQRYFPVVSQDGGLLPAFIAVRNGDSQHLEIVRAGNEKVLEARFNDARFYYQEDLKTSLEEKARKLGRVVFQDTLGSMEDKAQRLVRLTRFILESLGADPETAAVGERAALLCKADLVSEMVKELPDLQGIIGGIYARISGEPEGVARGIEEHYLPRGQGDALPETLPGKALAMADKLDTIAGYFGLGLVPTGSGDPYALRRQAQGAISMLRDEPRLSLSRLFDAAIASYREASLLRRPCEEIRADWMRFFGQRIEIACQEMGIRYDIIDAVLSAGFDNVCATFDRAQILQRLRETSDRFVATVTVGTRVGNIIRFAQGKGIAPAPQVDPALLVEPEEKALAASFEQTGSQIRSCLEMRHFEEAFHLLGDRQALIDRFFDAVMVMCEDERLRANRLALLNEIHGLFLGLADCSRIVVE